MWDTGRHVRPASIRRSTPTYGTPTSPPFALQRKPDSSMRHRQDIFKSSWCGSEQVHPLPQWLPPSAQVDIRHLRLGVRPAIRLHLPRQVTAAEVYRFARRYKWFAVLDDEGFVVLSPNPARARWIMTLDRSLGAHTQALGLALGYPPCCCRAAAALGEAHLDRWAMQLIDSRFLGWFRATSPKGYHNGTAWLSHIPCSTRCEPSVHMAGALAAARSVKNMRLGTRLSWVDPHI